ncbi:MULTISPECIES: response regulator [Haloferax]|uniref:Receiver box response regulator n=6 Tax=Haloferax TaxID=2251 RepID=D4GTP0_HALVD|nr:MULTISPECIES: response regulator [Haloferax]ADE02718.1 receiver box response regulator [Haloferax volcanii DS2]ELK55316.1 putative light and redox sensing histidine kinase [Haloferax sp. BAB-2207]ELY34526.1 putative light and redox sensing histidine kinase [Haloferax volcanii DS2]ELZ61040.1 putative light and redox sensing histidine kinase [Haloferax sp. ATCC BAA-646]ELZ67613.1 putative light and redox sensing histidine kinase [Haloferax sp. ATCC BAA-645]
MSETSIAATPRILAYGPQPEGLGARERDVNVEFVGSSRELFERLTERPVHLVICLHAPPAFEGIEAVKGIRRFDATVPVVLASRVQNTMLSLQAIQSQVTWSVGLAGDESVEEALSDLVVDASEWLEKQAA